MLLEPTFSGDNIVDTNTGLIPISDEEYLPLAITLPEGSFTEPFSQDLSLIEEPNAFNINEEVIDNNIDFSKRIYQNDSSELNTDSDLNDTLLNTNSLLGDTLEAQSFSLLSPQQVEAASAEMIPAPDGLEFVGGFGDYDGGEDVTFEVKDNRNNVIETFSLTGAGQGTLYKDDEKQYIFFSGTDATTNVDIFAKSDLVFEDYIGDSLSIETTGSIEGGDITLNDENTEEDSGLTLRAGIDTENSVSTVFDGYGLIDFQTNREMVDINNYAQVVGNDDYYGRDEFFFYNGQGLYYLPGYYSSRAFGINDNIQMVGEGLPTAEDTEYKPLVAYSDGSVQEFQESEAIGGRFSSNQSADRTYTYEAESSVRDINNYLEVAYYILNTPPPDAPAELELTPFEDAYFLAPNGNANGSTSVNIGYDLLNSDNSRAFGINDPGQVVGIDHSTNRAFVFDRITNSVTNLGTLPGDDYSAAYAINNQGQIVGVSSSSSSSRAFIYEDGTMKDMGISYVGDPESRVGIDINNQGQAVVTSAEGEPFVYQDGVVTNVNDWLIPEYLDLGYAITEAKGINDSGYIIAQGTFEGSDRAFLLVPTFAQVNRNINVGNISTFGETVLLEGAEVYLDGESIVTQGGDIGIDGRTIVNNNLAIDSSVTNESVGNPNADSVDSQSGTTISGGDLAFIGTLNSNATGEQNLTIKAGAGDLLFANTVGNTNPLFNLTVEGAGSVSAIRDLTVDNELVLEVINDIATANLSATGLANISLGTIGEEIFASSGNVTTGNIDALSLEVSNNGSFTADNLTTSDGDINIISLNELAVGQLIATNGGVDLISGTAGIDVNGTVSGDLGFIALAQLDINTDEIISSQDAVILKSSQGAITVDGSVTSFEEVSLASANDVTVEAVTSEDGEVALASATGVVTYSGVISAAKDLSLASAQDLTITKRIKTKLGTISLVSTEGSVKVNSVLNSGFNTYVAAKRNVATLGISGLGDVALESELGQVNVNGNVRSREGDIYISSLSKVNVGNIISSGGNVSVVSNGSSIKTGYIRTDSEEREGNVSLDALTNVKVAGVVDIDGSDYSIYAGDEGIITVAHQQLRRSTDDNNFIIGGINRSGALALVKPVPIPNPTPTPTGGGSPVPILIWIETFRRILDAGGTAPRHISEINPITGQPYADEAEFELVNALTDSQDQEIERLIAIPTIPLTWDYVEDEGEFKPATDEMGDRCFEIQLPGHLGTNYNNHHGYANYVLGTNDIILIPPRPIRGEASAIYDGRVLPGSAATIPSPLPSQSFDAVGSEPIDAFGEVKTGHRFLLRIINGNPLPEIPADPENNQERVPSDLERFEDLIDEIKGEVLIAQACGERYFLSFDLLGVARAGARLINTRLATEGISSIRVRYIDFPVI